MNIYNRRKILTNSPSIPCSYFDLSQKPVNPFVCTPGSFISDLFFYDELSRIAGVESGHNWFCTQMAARSKGTTLTPSTPCKSPYSSAPASPRTRPHSVDLDECLDYVLPMGSCDNAKSDSLSEIRGQGSFSSKGNCGAIQENAPPIRLASTGFIKRNEYRNLQNWRRWKSYDGARQAILEGEGQMALHEHEHEEAQTSSSEGSCAGEAAEQVAVTASAESNPVGHSSPEAAPAAIQSVRTEPRTGESEPLLRSFSPPRCAGSSQERRGSMSDASAAAVGAAAMPPGGTSPPRTAAGRKGSMDLRLDNRGGFIVTTEGDGGAGGGGGRTLTMQELTELVSSDQRDGAAGVAESMALLFTDAAHTVLQ